MHYKNGVTFCIIFTATIVAACAGNNASSQLAQASAPNAKGDGCINKPLDACLANLQTKFHFSPGQDIAAYIQRTDAVDINGKPVAKVKSLSISGTLDGWGDRGLQSAVLEYNNDHIVYSAGLSLPDNPSLARTTEEYDKTALYEAAALLLGTDCPTLNRAVLYKFFENIVKPKIIHDKKTIEVDAANADSSNFEHSPKLPFCGKKFQYTNLHGYNTDYISSTNSSGIYIRTEITFARY